MIRSITIASLLSLALAAPALAQTTPGAAATPPAASAPAPAADPADVGSPQSLVEAVYAVISGPQGKARDWARFRALMAPGARLVAIGLAPDGSVRRRELSVEDYVAHADAAFAKEGFYEHGVIPHAVVWAHVATVVSPYESRHAQGEPPFARGINSFQLTSDGKRWFIETILWEGESPAFPLPADAAAALKAR
jgi:hypothetical protein